MDRMEPLRRTPKTSSLRCPAHLLEEPEHRDHSPHTEQCQHQALELLPRSQGVDGYEKTTAYVNASESAARVACGYTLRGRHRLVYVTPRSSLPLQTPRLASALGGREREIDPSAVRWVADTACRDTRGRGRDRAIRRVFAGRGHRCEGIASRGLLAAAGAVAIQPRKRRIGRFNGVRTTALSPYAAVLRPTPGPCRGPHIHQGDAPGIDAAEGERGEDDEE